MYVLDDPLSAVDVHVGKHIFARFINGEAARGSRGLAGKALAGCCTWCHLVASRALGGLLLPNVPSAADLLAPLLPTLRRSTGAAKGAARLLVTNQLQYLPSADHVVVLDDGRVAVQGTYEECKVRACAGGEPGG